MSTLTIVLVLLALLCFVIATGNFVASKINFVALGLAILTIAYLLNGITIGAKG